jgi:hypothetical protein
MPGQARHDESFIGNSIGLDKAMPGIDFNAVILILDTLTEDRFSFALLDDDIGRQYGRDVISQALKLLADRELIVIMEGSDASSEAPRGSWSGKLDDFFILAQRDRADVATHFLELSARGKQVMDLLGIGAP